MHQRPELPTRQLNPILKSFELSKLPAVKYQSLDRDGHEVLVGRLKVPTQGGHAFILRRYDTGAISLTTMFRAAFPTATEAEERKETQWVKETYDLAGNNGSAREPHIVRLAGTWVSPSIALLPEIAECYNLADIIAQVANANPDPNISYRRSTKGGTTPKAGATTSPAAGSTTTSAVAAPTPKRRRESSPVAVPTLQPSLPPPRRSARTKSPAAPLPLPSVKSPKSVRITRTTRVAEVTTPGGSDETVVDEEAETIEMAKPSMSQDIADQKELIERLKAEREVQRMETDQMAAPLKRAREDEEKPERNFNPKEPETEERKIATNKRVSRFHLEPRQKSFAWGVAAFAIGMGAMSFLPNFF
ncbi:hypothetical protein EDC04DRAFT_2786378 [Pisolithus marmoratus]|nr:hypothetical protein EDC04DRAFT_2786378 [Pisolithus marmoratus]